MNLGSIEKLQHMETCQSSQNQNGECCKAVLLNIHGCHKYMVNEKDLCFNCKILTNTKQRFFIYKYHLYDLQGWEKGTTLVQQEC